MNKVNSSISNDKKSSKNLTLFGAVCSFVLFEPLICLIKKKTVIYWCFCGLSVSYAIAIASDLWCGDNLSILGVLICTLCCHQYHELYFTFTLLQTRRNGWVSSSERNSDPTRGFKYLVTSKWNKVSNLIEKLLSLRLAAVYRLYKHRLCDGQAWRFKCIELWSRKIKTVQHW